MSRQYSNDYASGGYPAQAYNPSYDYADASARQRQSPSPYYNSSHNTAYDNPSAAASSTYMNSTPPAYSSQQRLADPEAQARNTYGTSRNGPRGVSPSPFETVFDDHMYPATSRQNSNAPNGADTTYYGAPHHTPSEDNMFAASVGPDGIPLRDRSGNNKFGGAESPDHVYDAPQGGMASEPPPGAGGAGRKGVRFGELGMLGANNRKRIPIVVYIFTVVQIAVFIAEIVKNGILTGSPIMIHPSFNPMIGPSTYVLINMGSRFVPCMHNVNGVQSSTVAIDWPCPNSTTSDSSNPSNQCTLSQLCGFNGVPNPLYDGNAQQTPQPNQWFRFIVPMFLHAGVIHIGFNLLLQLTMGRDMERSIGSIRFFLVYVSSGIFGFVMGGNYAATGISSTGASGSLFGIIALTLLDLLYSWRDRRNPLRDLLFIILDIVISFVLGLLPGLDNFSHIGGFLMGLALGISVLHSPNALRRRIGDDTSYASVSGTYSDSFKTSNFVRNPVGFFKGRKPLWWAWWFLRAGAIVLVIVVFILLLNNFYIYHHTCGWCKYLSCLPVNNWCEIGNLQLTNTSTKRDLFSGAAPRLANLF
ncbi:Rhomboid family protein [Sporothrix schenckii 1099-18]|uniref:Rhomboid-type serine protease n=2 Tax=Sporothrix schenckii TaxID=29908 RepID=U7PPX8_SPOS1|nr:Rhomboid family protein [Sporothrix schenckii 1099-18]ERS96535.1 hypothetical protein HMPREF1624_06739 [Sporothrix schenckii ATCC 58251]KJR81204.1 Rhomboid family protein [Sporothrix schenckii 1099-18]